MLQIQRARTGLSAARCEHTRNRMCLAVILAVGGCLLFPAAGAGQIRITDGLESSMAGFLRKAGYDLDEESLIRAVQSHPRSSVQEVGIITDAIYFLPRLSKNERIVQALIMASLDSVESIAIGAMRALHQMGETNWHARARQLLPGAGSRDGMPGGLQRPGAPLQLASLLAEAGYGDGWALMLHALRENPLETRAYALREIGNFDGVPGTDGLPIDVVSELDALRSEVPSAAEVFATARQEVERQRAFKRRLAETREAQPPPSTPHGR